MSVAGEMTGTPCCEEEKVSPIAAAKGTSPPPLIRRVVKEEAGELLAEEFTTTDSSVIITDSSIGPGDFGSGEFRGEGAGESEMKPSISLRFRTFSNFSLSSFCFRTRGGVGAISSLEDVEFVRAGTDGFVVEAVEAVAAEEDVVERALTATGRTRPPFGMSWFVF